ncbi:helix-turn-helix transcriptional regulator [Enterococcus faecalis]|uniref:helix-turn-helix transcriptional regulator n=1 Tax=Enterococcus faecalis TaxID=1351 RepID=UPI0009B2B4D6|nr:helix-turn-helix transcriptional regulator [Enterococcus faecalis]
MLSPYKKTRRKAGMSQEELAKRMLVPVKLIKAYEREGVDPSLHYHANFKAVFNVSDEDINRLKITGGI